MIPGGLSCAIPSLPYAATGCDLRAWLALALAIAVGSLSSVVVQDKIGELVDSVQPPARFADSQPGFSLQPVVFKPQT